MNKNCMFIATTITASRLKELFMKNISNIERILNSTCITSLRGFWLGRTWSYLICFLEVLYSCWCRGFFR